VIQTHTVDRSVDPSVSAYCSANVGARPEPLLGVTDTAVTAAASAVLDAAAAADPPVTLDYLTLADPDTFTAVGPGYRGPAVLLVAARIGTTRLIDNVSLEIGGRA